MAARCSCLTQLACLRPSQRWACWACKACCRHRLEELLSAWFLMVSQPKLAADNACLQIKHRLMPVNVPCGALQLSVLSRLCKLDVQGHFDRGTAQISGCSSS